MAFLNFPSLSIYHYWIENTIITLYGISVLYGIIRVDKFDLDTNNSDDE